MKLFFIGDVVRRTSLVGSRQGTIIGLTDDGPAVQWEDGTSTRVPGHMLEHV